MCDTAVTLGDDGVLFAKNSDRDPNEAQVLQWIGAADHRPGDRVACTWIDVAQVPRTHAVLISRPWWMWGAEMGANEHGVVIGNEAVFTRRQSHEKALLGMDLLRLALERARTAEAALSVIVELLEGHGQGGPCSHERPGFTYDNGFLLADPDGAFVLETAGRGWASERVTGRGRSISNALSIPSFARANTDPLRTWVAAGSRRRRSTQRAAGRAGGPGDLMRMLRGHGGGAPVWSPVHGGLTAPCVHAGGLLASSQTTASWVSDLRGGVRHWATATAAPCTSLFKPVAIDRPVDLGPVPTAVFDDRSTWWVHELLHRSTMRNHQVLLSLYGEERDRVEERWILDRADPVAAFAEAGRLEGDWRARVAATSLADARPRWVRRRSHAADAAARIDVPYAV